MPLDTLTHANTRVLGEEGNAGVQWLLGLRSGSSVLPVPVSPIKQGLPALNHKLSCSGSRGKPGRSGGA